MEATVSRAELAEAVAFAARALPARPPLPALSAIALHADPDTLRVSASDQTVTATARLAAAVGTPGVARVPGRLLAEVTARLPREPVRLSLHGARLRLRCGGVHFALAALPPAAAPAGPAAPAPAGEVDTAALAAALNQVSIAAAREETPAATIGADDGVLGVRAGDREVLLRLVEAAGPDHLARIPTTFVGRVDLPAVALAEAVRRVALAAAGSAPVRLSLSPGRLEVSAGTAELAEAGESLPAAYQGPPLTAAYSPRYLTDVLAVLDADRVLLHLTGSTGTGPTLITGPEGPAGAGLRYVVAPRRPAGA